MPTIAFVSPKGGAGKTTSAFLLSTALAKLYDVTVIDADPNHPIKTWAVGGNTPPRLSIVSDANEDTIIDRIEAAATRTPFVVVDLEGTASKIKYTTKAQSPWRFTLSEDDIARFDLAAERFETCIMVLVCGGDGVCSIAWRTARELLGGSAGSRIHSTVSRRLQRGNDRRPRKQIFREVQSSRKGAPRFL